MTTLWGTLWLNTGIAYQPTSLRGQEVCFPLPLPSAFSLAFQSSLFKTVPLTRPEQRPFWVFSGKRKILNRHVRQPCHMRAQKATTGLKGEFVPRGCGRMEGDPSGCHQEVVEIVVMILSVNFYFVIGNRRRF